MVGVWIMDFFFSKRSWIMELQLRIRIRIKMPASRQELRFFENGHCFFSPGYYLLLTKKQDNSEFWCPMRVQIVRESQGISICVSVRVLVQKRRIQTFREHGQGWPCGRAPCKVLGLQSTANEQLDGCRCLFPTGGGNMAQVPTKLLTTNVIY